VLAGGAALGLGSVALALVSVWFVYGVITAIPNAQALRDIGTMAQATTLLDRHDRQAFTIYQEQRIEVPLAAVSPHLVDAIVSIEDQRFFEHGGIDMVRIAGAAWSNVRAGRRAQGGSTITQQLARQSFLTTRKTFRRKFTEMVVAARLENQFTKGEILGFYLNKVYFGDGLYGVEAASLGYFGKSASAVSVAEAALLAGLVQSPSTYAPTVNLERATARRNVVLGAMREAGAVDEATYDAAVSEPVAIDDGLRRAEAYGQYYKEEVRRFLVDRFGWDRVYTGGLKVYTTVDVDMQKAAEAEVTRALADIEQRQGRSGELGDADPLQAALVAMDPQTGEVRALVGGRDFATSSFSRATQAMRQPGSAFKPFVYAAALEQGFLPTTVITNLDDPVMTLQGEWVPEEGHTEDASMTMRTALRTSSNRAAVRMLQQVGIPVAVEYAKQLGVGAVPAVPSLALGSGEVTLVAMTAAYSAFANGGLVPLPTLVRRVESTDGEVLYQDESVPHRAVSESTAYVMATMLADVIDTGTGASARRAGFTRPAAGKTGTTNEYRDAWFVGFTPRLTTGVWIGYDQPRTIMAGGYASELAAPLWGRFMRTATRNDGRGWLKAPATVTSVRICPLSGQLATDACDGAYIEHFTHGAEPGELCPLHRTILGGTLRALADLVVPRSRASAEPVAPAPVARVAPVEVPPSAAKVEEEPPRKRGFLSRIFGIGRGRSRR
jgi:penicillin-binding protein 1A